MSRRVFTAIITLTSTANRNKWPVTPKCNTIKSNTILYGDINSIFTY